MSENLIACAYCGIEFQLRRKNQRFCSKKCSNSLLNGNGRTKHRIELEKICERCGVHFTTKRSEAKFCSGECFHKSRIATDSRVCLGCDVAFECKPFSKGKFCTQKCFGQYAGSIRRIHPQHHTCAVCQTTYFTQKGRRGPYCSAKCSGLAKRHVRDERPCITCGNLFEALPNQNQRACSFKCRQRDNSFITEEYRQKISVAGKKACAKPGVSERRSEQRRQEWANRPEELKQKILRAWTNGSYAKTSDTSIERAVKAILNVLEIRYVQNEYLLGYFPDFQIVHNGKKICIECDGDYFHSKPGAKEHDAKKDAKLRAAGYTVIRLTESEIKQDANRAVQTALRLVA